MAGDAVMLMRGLVKLSKAILEVQTGQLRQAAMGKDVVNVARSWQVAAEERFSAAMGRVQVSSVFLTSAN